MPSEPGLDDCQNHWGVHLVNNSDRCNGTYTEFQILIEQWVPGYSAGPLDVAGSASNTQAILHATKDDPSRCLFGLGCYVVGAGSLQRFSATTIKGNMHYAITIPPTQVPGVTENDMDQIVVLPYHIIGTVATSKLRVQERRCIKVLEQQLMAASLEGRPYRAFVLEYMLSGNGGVLSIPFLMDLSGVLRKHDVVIIADEIMTGGRVGPSLLMTLDMPDVVKERVKYITMGKCLQCGVCLYHKTALKTSLPPPRGTTTKLANVGQAFYCLTKIIQQLLLGAPQRRYEELVKVFKKQHKGDFTQQDLWGRGGIIFMAFVRSFSVAGNFKQRNLMQLFPGLKIKLGNLSRSGAATAQQVNTQLSSVQNLWLKRHQQRAQDRYTLLEMTVIDYSIANPNQFINTARVVEFVGGMDKYETLAEDWRSKTSSQRKTEHCLAGALVPYVTARPPSLQKRRKGKKRLWVYEYVRPQRLLAEDQMNS